MKTWNNMTKKELLTLPKRAYDKVSVYDFILFVNTRKKHDSGYNLFAIIGCLTDGTMEIAGYMDDLRMFQGGVSPTFGFGFAFDCSMHGVFRLHSFDYRFGIGINTSTTDLFFVPITKVKEKQ